MRSFCQSFEFQPSKINLHALNQMNNISETAYLVAMYRALETERKDALFQDSLARQLAGGLGKVLVQVIGNKQQITSAIAIRTYLIDELILQVVESEKINVVVNLAAGLDTRPYRLPLPLSLRWIEVDLPEITSYKDEELKDEQPVCFLERVHLDLTNIHLRKTLFSKINSIGKALIITEGLLSYLSEAEVASLAIDMFEQPNFNWWLFELTSSLALKHYHQHHTRRIFDQYFANGNQTLLFAPENGVEFFQQYGWNCSEVRSIWKESLRLRREMKFARIVDNLMRSFAQKYWERISNVGSIILLKQIEQGYQKNEISTKLLY